MSGVYSDCMSLLFKDFNFLLECAFQVGPEGAAKPLISFFIIHFMREIKMNENYMRQL